MTEHDDETPAVLRAPPWSSDMEQSVLGCLMQDNTCLAVVSDLIAEASFYAAEHRFIFGAIVALIAEHKIADPITVDDRIKSIDGIGDSYQGLSYLNALYQCVPSVRAVRVYAERVADKAAERALIAGMDEASRICWDESQPLPERIERISAVIQQVERQRKSPASRRVPFMRLQDLKESSAAVRWLVKHVIPTESIGVMFGGSGTFKSFIALDAALHVAHGLPWLGRKTKKGAVVYIAAEGGSGLWPRIDAWHRARGLRWTEIEFFVVPAAIDIGVDAWRVVDAAQLAGVTPILVVVDTLSQTFSGEENSANEIAAYFRELGARFRQIWQCAVLVIHHSGHSATERPRGSSAIRSNVDFMLGVFRDADDMLATMECHKQKDGDKFDDATFSLTSMELGRDDDGDALTSLVAARVRDTEEVLEAMREGAKKGRKGRNGLLIDLLPKCETVKELRAKFYEACDGDNAETRRQAFHRTLDWAKKSGILIVNEDRITILRRIEA